jgi:GNAT superfamily N-acetyltransferase
MKISIIENPKDEETSSIEKGVFDYGLAQVEGIVPTKWAFHAVEDGELLGGATGRLHLTQFYLDLVWVKEEFRSKGIGTGILNFILKFAQENRCRRILLNTLNVNAVRLYKRLGYKTLTVIDG